MIIQGWADRNTGFGFHIGRVLFSVHFGNHFYPFDVWRIPANGWGLMILNVEFGWRPTTGAER